MPIIGAFDDIIFTVSDKRLLTIYDMVREISGRWNEHEVINAKPIAEFLGPGLDVITFTVDYNGLYGVSPRTEINKWFDYARGGKVGSFIIGEIPIGVDKWYVASAPQTWDTIINDGKLLKAKVDITLKEYVSYYD